MMRLSLFILILVMGCRTRVPGERAQTSTYKPVLNQGIIHPQGVQDAASGALTDPGSPKSPQVQQLPQASP